MSTDASFVRYVQDQLNAVRGLSFRKMFGEYAMYCQDKVVALICDNQFFLRPTHAGRVQLNTVVEAPPYRGAKPHFLLSDELEDPQLMASLIKATYGELPVPKPKKKASVKAKPATKGKVVKKSAAKKRARKS